MQRESRASELFFLSSLTVGVLSISLYVRFVFFSFWGVCFSSRQISTKRLPVGHSLMCDTGGRPLGMCQADTWTQRSFIGQEPFDEQVMKTP